MKIFLELTYMMVSECEQCKEPHTYPKPYRKLCEECEPKGESNMNNQEEPSEDQDEHSRKRIKKWISNYVVPNYENGVDENDLDEILMDFEKFLMEEEARRLQQ